MMAKLSDLGSNVICPSGGTGVGDYEVEDASSGGDFSSYDIKCLIETDHGTFTPGEDGS
jgi:hypothetical protein